jgi:cell division initiation protein
MNEAARKSAEMIVADAENKAEQILNKASGRLAQVQEDIIQLKGQRIQFEVQLRSIIEAHFKLFELGKNQMLIRDDEYEKSRMLKNNGFSSQ